MEMLCFIIPVILTALISGQGTEGSEVRLCTPVNGDYRFINDIRITNRTSLMFSVKSCQTVKVILTNNFTSLRPAYEIVLGRKRNTKSRITTSLRYQYKKSTYYTVSSPEVLNCTEFRDFWILWNHTISMGKGQAVGVDSIATTNLSSLISVNYIGIKTLSGFNDAWIFQAVWHLGISISKQRHLKIVSLDIVRDLLCEETTLTEISSTLDESTTTVYHNVIPTVDTDITTSSSTTVIQDKSTIMIGSTSKWTTTIASDKHTTSAVSTFVTPTYNGNNDILTSASTTVIQDKSTIMIGSTSKWSTLIDNWTNTIASDKHTTSAASTVVTPTYNGNSLTTHTVKEFSKQHELLITTQRVEDTTKCMCPCVSVGNNFNLPSDNLTLDELRVYLTPYLKQLEKAISVNSKSTVAYKATKISASDQRMSSRIMGWFGALILGTLVGVLVMIDILNLFLYCKYFRN